MPDLPPEISIPATAPAPPSNAAEQGATDASGLPPERYACIDVGTNSVKMVVADLAGGRAQTVFEMSQTTRLGEGMQAQAMRLREIPMRRSLDAIADMTTEARGRGVRGLAAVGTAALRDAENRDEFLQRVQERCGLALEVIAGEEEARLSFLAVRRDPLWRGAARLLVIDIGGGSTEVIQGVPTGDGIARRVSVNLGAVKLTERFLRSDPPTILQLNAANQAVAEQLALVAFDRAAEFTIAGVGGTLTTLGAMALGGVTDKETLHGYRLATDALEALIERLASRTLEERKTLPGLDPRRADIILGGAILLSQALAFVGSPSVAISTRGLRWGVLYDRFLPA